ncbi:MAG: hypothetical protein U0228_23480 [Myxococcaceae bacterium]
MDEGRARAIVDHVRRFTDALFRELRELEGTMPPDEVRVWRQRTGQALGGLQTHLLYPIEEEHPNVIPKSMGGVGPDRPLS